MTTPIEEVEARFDYGYKLSDLKRKNALRHSRGWVSSVVDFVLLGLPIVAPIPNLLNLRIALAPVMGLGASTIAAIAFELLLFGSAEIILYLQDKQMRRDGYKTALKIAVACGVTFIVILLILIGWYEVPQHGLAVLTLPFVSVISIAFLSLKRWADIRESIESERVESERSEIVQLNVQIEHLNDESERLNGTIERLTERLQVQQSERQSERLEREQLEQQLADALNESERSTREGERLNGIISRLTTELSTVREDNARMKGERSASRTPEHLNGRSDKRTPERSNSRSGKAESVQKMLDFFRDNPTGSMADAATHVGKSKSTISGYLNELELKKEIHRNGDGVKIL